MTADKWQHLSKRRLHSRGFSKEQRDSGYWGAGNGLPPSRVSRNIKVKTKKSKKSKALAVRKQNKNLIFAGAQRVMAPPKNERESQERKLIMAVSQAIEVSPLSVVILGNLPYVDNKGRKEKLEQYSPNAKFEYNWIQRSVSDIDKAICEARIVKGGKTLTPWIAGECSPATIKMRTLSGYQNHIAQTRAENRAFEYLHGLRLRNDLLAGLQKMLTEGKVNPNIAAKAIVAGTMSAEEYTGEKPKQQEVFVSTGPQEKINGKEVDEILRTAVSRGFKSKTQVLAGVNRLLGIKIGDLTELTKRQAKSVMIELLRKKSK